MKWGKPGRCNVSGTFRIFFICFFFLLYLYYFSNFYFFIFLFLSQFLLSLSVLCFPGFLAPLHFACISVVPVRACTRCTLSRGARAPPTIRTLNFNERGYSNSREPRVTHARAGTRSTPFIRRRRVQEFFILFFMSRTRVSEETDVSDQVTTLVRSRREKLICAIENHNMNTE